ncbi:hypothetical protein FDECE_12473 [Fusarium decemcellulare]|nr:hypothetical protein FDECE_12473 [Fusarium decemcellulare]
MSSGSIGPSDAIPTSAKPTRQSPNTCSACRARKVRCDGRRNVCTSCERLNLNCSFQNPQSATVPIRRRRAHAACLACHSRKIRCSEERPNCRRCLRLDLSCVYPSNRSGPSRLLGEASLSEAPQRLGMRDNDTTLQVDVNPDEIGNAWPSQDSQRESAVSTQHYDTMTQPEPGSGHAESDEAYMANGSVYHDPPEELVLSAFKLFFGHICHTPVFSFLHKASIMDQYRNGVLEQCLTFSLIGIVSVLDNLGPGMQERGEQYIAQAESLVLRDMENPTISKVQALIFIIKHRAFSKRFSSVFMLTAMACRFAMGLRLNYEDTELSFLARESCRRTMWSLYLIDSVLSAGYQDFTLSSPSLLRIQLPSPESNFEMDIPHQTGYLNASSDGHSESQPSPLALTIRIMYLRQCILQFTKQAVGPHYKRQDLQSDIESLQTELNNYLEHLPTQLKLSTHNIKIHAHSSNLSNFITMHITWHGAQSILYRLALDGLIEALPAHVLKELDTSFVMTCQQRCFDTAKSMAQILGTLLSIRPDSVPLDLDIAVSVYQCLRMVIYSYRALTGVTFDTLDQVMIHCRTCVQFLETMFCNYKAVEDIVIPLLATIWNISLTVRQKRDAHTLIETALIPLQDTPESEVRDGSLRTNEKQGSKSGHHILSKHSLVGQIQIPDKKESFLISPSPSDAQLDTLQTINGSSRPLQNDAVAIMPAFSPSMHVTSTPLRGLSERTLPDFELDSAISLPSSWLEALLPTHDGYV